MIQSLSQKSPVDYNPTPQSVKLPACKISPSGSLIYEANASLDARKGNHCRPMHCHITIDLSRTVRPEVQDYYWRDDSKMLDSLSSRSKTELEIGRADGKIAIARVNERGPNSHLILWLINGHWEQLIMWEREDLKNSIQHSAGSEVVPRSSQGI